MEKTILYLVHDPMCSWCWGFKPTVTKLINELPDNLRLLKLLGGLARDSDEKMSEDMQLQIQGNWKRIEETIPGIRFNYHFWKECIPKRSTYPACRAVIAAGLQDDIHKDVMVSAIQNAYYKRAMNPSEIPVLVKIADEIGLDPVAFEKDIQSDAVERKLQAEISQSRKLNVYSFPSLVLQLDHSFWPVPIDYNNVSPMLETIKSIITTSG